MKEFLKDIIEKHFPKQSDEIFKGSDLIQYLDLKTSAIYGNSKTRKSLGNIYAIYAILHFYMEDGFFNQPNKYKDFDGYEFTKLLTYTRTLYGGEKIQNHALNSRLNLEFDNKTTRSENKGKFVIVQNQGKYLVHIDYLYYKGSDLSKCILEIIDKYVFLLREKDDKLIHDLEELSNEKDISIIRKQILSLLTEDSEARIFEIISFAILKNYYKKIKVYFGYSLESLSKEELTLFKTGRTNANDGGIDFVMRPLGRFFQVTEVGNYDKYFLDIEKVEHFPISFVIKTNKKKETIQREFDDYIAKRSGGMKAIINLFKESIEEIITINELKERYESLDEASIKELMNDIVKYYKLEMNFNEA